MGDGNFKWYVGYAEDAESFGGPHDTREEAVNAGMTEYDPGDAFYILEADKSVMSANIDWDGVAEYVMDELCEANEECFGEDGPDDPWSHVQKPHATLGAAVYSAVKTWLEANPAKTWAFGTQRNGEYIAVPEA